MDFESIVIHEIGHRLGYPHTSITAPWSGGAETFASSKPVMYPILNNGDQRELTRPDDNMAVLARSGVRWSSFDSGDSDIDVDSGPTFQTITVTAGPAVSGGLTVWQLFNGSWSQLSGQGAVRLSGNGGVVWIVQDDGDIYRWTGSWEKIPGCARDVGVGGDSSVWVIGCNAIGSNFGIFKFNGSSFDTDSAGGAAVTISVGPRSPGGANVPWVITSGGSVFRRSSGSVSSGSWSTLPGTQVLGSDIAVSASGYPWLIGTDTQPGGHSIYVWNEQSALAAGSPNPVALTQWRLTSGNAVRVSTDNEGFPYVIANDGSAWAGQ
jgi:hypothetical protein